MEELMSKPYIRVPDAAQYLSVSESTIWLYVKQGKLKTIKLSPRVTVIDIDELNRFINQAKEFA